MRKDPGVEPEVGVGSSVDDTISKALTGFVNQDLLQVIFQAWSPPVRYRPSNAKLRRELRDPSTPAARRRQVYAFLLYRRRHTGGR